MSAVNLPAGARSYANVEYSSPGGHSLLLDAHIPEGRGPFPAVIIVHGGAWVTGDRKRSVEPLFAPFTNGGFAWFSISYRMPDVSTTRSAPAMAASAALLGGAIDDVRSAVAYVRANSAKYNVDPHRIALVGESAGAQLSAMAALKPWPNGDVQAVIGLYCPSDLAALIQTSPVIPDSIRRAVNRTRFEGTLLAYLRELSPMSWIRPDAPPFLLIHGTADTVVPFEQSVNFCEALRKAGDSCDLFPVTGGGHGLRWWEPAPRLLAYKPYMIQWLSRQMATSNARR